MNNKYQFSIQKVALLCVLFSIVVVQSSFASGETNNKKHRIISKISIDALEPETNKSDSLKSTQNTLVPKADSVNVGTKSISGASYNILFQVIYRNSFSEILEGAK